MLVFAYQKDSPMLTRYLQMNGMRFVQVWREPGRNQNRVALCGSDGCGFPVSANSHDGYFHGSLRECDSLAARIAEHTGLSVLPTFR